MGLRSQLRLAPAERPDSQIAQRTHHHRENPIGSSPYPAFKPPDEQNYAVQTINPSSQIHPLAKRIDARVPITFKIELKYLRIPPTLNSNT